MSIARAKFKVPDKQAGSQAQTHSHLVTAPATNPICQAEIAAFKPARDNKLVRFGHDYKNHFHAQAYILHLST